MNIRPTKAQWIVMWCAALLAVYVWLNLGTRIERWDLIYYLRHSARPQERGDYAKTIIFLGGLLAWQIGSIDLQPRWPRWHSKLGAWTDTPKGYSTLCAIAAIAVTLTLIVALLAATR